MQTLMINTPSHAYPIHIGNDLLGNFDLFAPHITPKTAIVTNETIAKLYLQPLIALLEKNHIQTFPIILPDGEAYKNHDSLNQIYDALLQNFADRKTTLIALGGGVIGDITGFASATYQRGIPFIQIPTTLLSQVDSSVGGKTAINHPLGKNMIGAFYQPQVVIADLTTLNTLPAREFSAGMAEVIKYALLGDSQFLVWLEQNMAKIMQQDPEALAYLVAHCCQMKADIVAEDETEQGIRAHLNLGHTFGHAIEAEMGYGTWLHGEAVSAGTVLACRLSEQLGCISSADTERVATLFRQANLPDAPPRFSYARWLEHMTRDKKTEYGKIRFITLKQLGEATITVPPAELLEKTLQPYINW